MVNPPAAGSLRVIHCSDIHLAGDHAEAEHYRAGLVTVLAAGLAHCANLILIAGDLFDSNQADGDTIEWAMETLARQPCPVAMIPGNHDCLENGSIYHRYDFDRLPNVEMLTAPEGEVRLLPNLELAVWGKGMVDHCTQYRPVANTPTRPTGARWYLGLGHGIYVPAGGETGRSSPVHAEEIADSPCDYLALGHHHAALEVHEADTAAAYCGSPTDTIGAGATYAVVDLVDGQRPRVEIRLVE